MQLLYKKFRGILNKLTPEKFDTLLVKVHQLTIDTEERLEGCIAIIFEKVMDHFLIDPPNHLKVLSFCLVSLGIRFSFQLTNCIVSV